MPGDEKNITRDYRAEVQSHQKFIKKGVEQTIVNVGPGVVGLVAGIASEQPWVGVLAKKIADVVIEPVAKTLATFMTSNTGKFVVNPVGGLFREWLHSNDPIATKVREVCLNLNKKVNSPNFDMLAFLGGEFAPATQALFWTKLAEFSGSDAFKNLDLASIAQGGELSQAGSALVHEGAKAAFGDHYDTRIGDMLVTSINEGLKTQILSDKAAPPPAPESPHNGP